MGIIPRLIRMMRERKLYGIMMKQHEQELAQQKQREDERMYPLMTPEQFSRSLQVNLLQTPGA